MEQLKIAVIGLGYVGLPVALAFSKVSKTELIAFDINPTRLLDLSNYKDSNLEIRRDELKNVNWQLTSNKEDLKNVNVYIITVPTPIDRFKKPKIIDLLQATKTVASFLKKDDVVVYESTVWPFCTRERCLPILESFSGLTLKDFHLGYSPERINPADKYHTFKSITKVVSGDRDESLSIIANLYSKVLIGDIHKAPSIEVAEAAKIIENTQRDINIAFMNELSQLFDKLKINTFEVLEAASTKWNFLNFYPGLVGGHCIGVDPYYLAKKAQEVNFYPEMILSGRKVNEEMTNFIVNKVFRLIVRKAIVNPIVNIFGLTFKPNCVDTRNSKALEIFHKFRKENVNVNLYDEISDSSYRCPDIIKSDILIIAVCHDIYLKWSLLDFANFLKQEATIYDLSGKLKNHFKDSSYNYFTL